MCQVESVDACVELVASFEPIGAEYGDTAGRYVLVFRSELKMVNVR